MCPFAVAGLGLRYLRINSSLIFGHPLRNPLRVALINLEIFGLHKDWWENLTLFARVNMEWAKAATCRSSGVGSGACGRGVSGSVHKSVAGSF